jgi:hypothetical protein
MRISGKLNRRRVRLRFTNVKQTRSWREKLGCSPFLALANAGQEPSLLG